MVTGWIYKEKRPFLRNSISNQNERFRNRNQLNELRENRFCVCVFNKDRKKKKQHDVYS